MEHFENFKFDMCKLDIKCKISDKEDRVELMIYKRKDNVIHKDIIRFFWYELRCLCSEDVLKSKLKDFYLKFCLYLYIGGKNG